MDKKRSKPSTSSSAADVALTSTTRKIKLINRILCISSTGLKYEADPRHAELLARALGLEGSKDKLTPGSKDCLESEIADGVERDEAQAQEEMNQFVCSLLPNSLKRQPSGAARMPAALSLGVLSRLLLLFLGSHS